ncbi:MAG: hypothetical protein JWR17_3470 [Pseudomonas sp.]|nr:hypothetical protein [Pseudomonas sp.]
MPCPVKKLSVVAMLCAVVVMAAAAPVIAEQLPLDVIGLYVTDAKPLSGGKEYRVNDTITLPGGVTVIVSKTSADTGVAEVSIAQPIMHACSPRDAVLSEKSSGAGTGATFSLSLLTPTAYGTHLLTRCYAGPALTVQRSDTNAAKQISFLPDGSLDTKALDRFTVAPDILRTYAAYNSGVTPRVSLWNDQGGGLNDALQSTPLERPTLTVDRMHGNSRAIMFDSHGGAGEWDPANTSLSLPSGVALDANHFTIAVIGEATSAFIPPAFITVGAVTGINVGLQFGRYGSRTMACDGAGNNAYAAVVPTETPAVIVCTADEHGKTIDMLGTSTTTTGGNNFHLAGGALGQSGDKRSGLVNISAAIVVPWPVDAATRAALNASLDSTFAMVPQTNGVIVVLGDSHSDGAGAPFQQGWTHQMMKQLGRNDIQLVNAAIYGGRLSYAIDQWKKFAQPNLEASHAANKIVILQGGYNDQQSGQTADQIIATYKRGAALAHEAGAKVVCVADVIRAGAVLTNSTIAVVNNAIRAPLTGCDAVIDWARIPAFNQPAGPYPPPYFASDRVHLTAKGQALQAQIAATVVNGLLR